MGTEKTMPKPSRPVVTVTLCATLGLTALLGAVAVSRAHRSADSVTPRREENMLVNGKAITPVAESHVGVGSFPFRMATSPDGRFALTSDMGARAYITAVELHTGKVTGKVRFIAPPRTPGGTAPRRDDGL